MLCVFLFCSILFGCHKFFPSFPAFDILKFLLIVLLILHTVWTYFILKILHRAVIAGKVTWFIHIHSEWLCLKYVVMT